MKLKFLYHEHLVFLGITPCQLVNRYRHFKASFYLLLGQTVKDSFFYDYMTLRQGHYDNFATLNLNYTFNVTPWSVNTQTHTVPFTSTRKL
jgi:hypothetical protein